MKDNNPDAFHVLYKNNNICLGETLFPDCPVRNILARVDDKWSLLLMHQMMHHQESMRFSDIRKAIPDISQKVLTSTLLTSKLRNLEADGFLVRKVYAEVPPHTEYTLTPRAHSFMAACRPMADWAIDNFAAIMKDRVRTSSCS